MKIIAIILCFLSVDAALACSFGPPGVAPRVSLNNNLRSLSLKAIKAQGAVDKIVKSINNLSEDKELEPAPRSEYIRMTPINIDLLGRRGASLSIEFELYSSKSEKLATCIMDFVPYGGTSSMCGRDYQYKVLKETCTYVADKEL